jgi:hypothetical protein
MQVENLTAIGKLAALIYGHEYGSISGSYTIVGVDPVGHQNNPGPKAAVIVPNPNLGGYNCVIGKLIQRADGSHAVIYTLKGATYRTPEDALLAIDTEHWHTINGIDIEIEFGISSRDWQRVATKRAQRIAEERGIEWRNAKVFVKLPERGRCFTKQPGQESLIAHG